MRSGLIFGILNSVFGLSGRHLELTSQPLHGVTNELLLMLLRLSKFTAITSTSSIIKGLRMQEIKSKSNLLI